MRLVDCDYDAASYLSTIDRDELRRCELTRPGIQTLMRSSIKKSSSVESSGKIEASEEQKRKIPLVKNSTDGIKSAFGDMKIDEDKALLLSLVLLLAEENADETLILALLYMLS
jgi:hypothetical protein